MRKFLLRSISVMLLYFPTVSFAQQQCDCDFVISTSPLEWMFDGAAKGVKPGDKICFASGTRLPIVFYNIKGTASKPVIITNMCNGKVTIAGTALNPYGIEVHKSANFKFTGAANPSQQYGIEIKGPVMGIDLRDLSTDFEVDHFKITNLTYAGIVAKTDPTCDAATWRGNFTMRNTSFHDNYISDVLGEAFYIGNSHYHTTVTVYCTTGARQVQEHEVIGVKIYNNIVKNTGNDGIQVGGATSQCYIHHNNIYNVGLSNGYGQQSGIQINPGTNAECYNNIIDKGTGYGIFAGGRGASHLYNNLITNHRQGGILAQDYPPVDTRGFVIANNTLINNKDYGIYMFSQNTSQNLFINNIIVAYNQSNYQYVKLNNPGGIKWTESNNIKTADIGSVKFANAGAKDYRLTAASSAKDTGKDAKANGVTIDLDETARPQGGLFDIGAYEFKTSIATGNKPPIANAGADKLINLPATSISLTGTGTDSDGSIAAYSWSKVSGGTATLKNATTPTLAVSGLVTGSYTFRLTVKDNSGASASDDVVLIVNNPPAVNAGVAKTVTLPKNALTFTGRAQDSDGSIASYTWTKVSGGSATLSNANSPTAGASGLVAGSYKFRLTVKDNRGATSYDDLSVTVKQASSSNPPASGNPNPSPTQIVARFSFTNIARNISGWNELVGAPHAAVIAKTDPTTGYTVSSVSTGQWNPVNYGTPTSSFSGGVQDGTVQPSSIMVANWFNYNAAYGTTVNGIVQKDNISISGLNPAHKYRLQMGASRQSGTGASDQYGTFQYVVNGTAAKNLLVTDNKSLQVEFSNVIPNAQGKVGISARKVSGSTMNFGYIGWLVITDLTTGTTTARSADADIVANDEEIPQIEEEQQFKFNDKIYEGTNYNVEIYTGRGERIFSGKWNEDFFNLIFQPGELYMYQILSEGKKVDIGKIYVTQ